jgi:hypothetical protein
VLLSPVCLVLPTLFFCIDQKDGAVPLPFLACFTSA